MNSMNTLYRFVCLLTLLLRFHYSGISQTDANSPLHGISIYIDYPDVRASVSPARLDSLLNGVSYQEPGVQRSFRKYWHEQSRRNIAMHHDVFFYTAPMPSTHYAALTWQEGILLWRDALEWVIKNYPNYTWNSLSLDNKGALRSVMIISSAWGPAGVGATHGPNWTLSNGVNIRTLYGSVLMPPWNTMNNLFMTLHESGHGIFGLPDTYDTEYNSGGTSFYTLMSGGQYDVEPIGAPFRVENNWGYLVEKEAGTHTITLRADGDSVVVVRNLHDPLEFFSIEARKQSTIGNSLFPAPLALLLWHSDTKVSSSNTLENMTPLKHYRHSIEQADGLFELEASVNSKGNIGDLFLPGTSFTNTTTPNSKWWDGTSSGFELSNIQLLGSDKISFTITIPKAHEDHYPEIPQAAWSLVWATPWQPGYEATKAFDGDAATYYHVPWGNTNPRAHEIVIDLGKSYTVNELYYTANKNDSPPWEGRIENYEVYISADTNNWGSAVASGSFFQTGITQYVLFAKTTGRYLKFSALTSFANDVRTSIAEISLRGVASSSVSVNDTHSHEAFLLYPNPSAGGISLELPNNDEAEITVLSVLGEQLLQQHSTQRLIHLQLENSGVYIIAVKTKLGTATQKCIVHR